MLSRRGFLKGLGAAIVAALWPKQKTVEAEIIAPMGRQSRLMVDNVGMEIVPAHIEVLVDGEWIGDGPVCENLRKVCELIQKSDSRFVSATGNAHYRFDLDLSCIRVDMWSEACQEHLIGKMEVTNEFLLYVEPDIAALMVADAMLTELEWSEKERLDLA